MPLTRIEAENFTVFEDITIPFSKGLNVLVGENGNNTAKTRWNLIHKDRKLFSTKTKRDAEITTEEKWEKQMSDLTSVFIPAKEILSNAWNLDATVKMGNVEFDDTYLDIIAAAKIDISKGVDSAARKNIWIFYKKSVLEK